MFKFYTIIVLFTITLFSCIPNQKLKESFRLNPGMSKDEVLQILGKPIASEFTKNVEEWHYCSTGFNADEHLALFFHNGKLIEKKAYTVTMADTRGVGGSCQKFIKRGTYQEPDSVTEIRLKF